MQLAAILMGPVLMEMMIGVVMATFIARMMVLNTPITKEEFYVDQVVNGRKCVETLKIIRNCLFHHLNHFHIVISLSEVNFIKVSLWGHNGMKDAFAGGSSHFASGLDIEGYEKLALSDRRIVGFTMRPDSVYAKFYTYLGGTASPISESWPTYIRKDLFNPSWKVGSHLQIGDRNIRAPAPTNRKPYVMY